MKLIKFSTNNNYLVNTLKVSELFFNKVENFNDPFEGVFRFKLWSDELKIKEFYFEHFNGNPKKVDFFLNNKGELEKEINKIFEYRHLNNAVTCFSDALNSTNILMWAHYANNHAGICMVFNEDELDFHPGRILMEEANTTKTVITKPKGPLPVTYQEEYLNTDPLNGNLNQTTFLTTKFKVWDYEREFRYIAPRQGAYSFNPKSLTQIIFGLRTPPNFKTQIKNIVNDLYEKVSFKRITLKDGDFAFELEDEDFIR